MKTTIEVESSLGIRHLLTSLGMADPDFKGKPLTDAILTCIAKIGHDEPGSKQSEMHKAMLNTLLTAAMRPAPIVAEALTSIATNGE